MKKPKRKKPEPKFGVGQAVMVMGLGAVSLVKSKRWYGGRWQYLTTQYYEFDEVELRPLTAKEIGPRRNRV
jgi:hypothetical protein